MRNIPISIQRHKRGSATTLCQIIRIETQDGEVIGMTSLDRDVVYNDGQGEVVYRAAIGFQPASIYGDATFGVDNSEIMALVPEFNFDLNEYRVNSGAYNYAKFSLYEVNYENLLQGHWVVMSGSLGEMKSENGLTLFGELRSILDEYRKPLCELDSIGCRARFGSQRGDERFPCGFDAESLWITGTVTAVGFENTRSFTDALQNDPDGFYEPGLVQFLTGQNAGKYVEVERSMSTGEIDLNFTTPYPIVIGDTYRRRRDCNKQARDDSKGCKHWFGAQWPGHFRGEPDIPLGDAGTITTPGAGVGPGAGGSTHENFEE